MMTLVLVLKIALVVFVVGGVVTLIARGVRRWRANRSDPRWKGHRSQPGYQASARGVMPNTPLPEWAYHDDDDEGGTPEDGVTAIPPR
jgi:hypothetical protein